jgi:hypothetical protein
VTSMKERAQIGTRWLRRRDKTAWVLWQSHRRDRIAELRLADLRTGSVQDRKVFVSFSDLRTKFEEIEA